MANQGILQAQLKVKNSMNLENGFIDNPLLKSVEGEINLTDENSFRAFAGNTAIEHLDTVKSSSQNAVDLTNSLNNLPNLKYVKLEGNYESKGNSFDNNTNLQKLDLSESLQVKPEDFKDNNNLRELPKLDYSNPDLTDIITNDTNLKPTTFDISNESNTNKLGIHGDSTHQLGNLEFVKVNPEAPFDNQITPQINTSYTSLDKNGLVNLFNTLPYNIGYQVIGNPTIEDGVVSNFSNDNYLQSSSRISVSGNSIIEFFVKFTTPSTIGNGFIIGASERFGCPGIQIYNNNLVARIFYQYSGGGTTARVPILSNISVNTTYYVKVIFDYKNKQVVKSISTDGTNWNTNSAWPGDFASYASTYTPYINFGFADNIAFTGSIDLNETYIKVNSQVSTGPVGYTVVGSPTITDGVASGFSSSVYLKLDNAFSTASEFEMVIKIKANNNPSQSDFFAGCNGFYFYRNWTSMTIEAQKADNTYTYLSFGSIPADTDYWLRVIHNGTKYDLAISTNGVDFTDVNSYEITLNDYNDYFYLGARPGRTSFNGSIDLNQTYIKVNGKLWFGHESKQVTWFKGKPSQIKVLDISGATGISSLTNDDKAIVTNKGWRLVTDGSNSKNYTIEDGKLIWANPGLYLKGPVNYAVSGSPTIVDNVASGLGLQTHLRLSTALDSANFSKLEAGFRVQSPVSLGNGWTPAIYVYSGSAPMCGIYTENGNSYFNIFGWDMWQYSISADTWYRVHYIYENGTVNITIYDDNDQVLDARTGTHTPSFSNAMLEFCPQYGSNIMQAIDFKKTYIKLDDQLWFYGKNYASTNIAPVPSGYTYGTTTTSAIGWVDIRTQQFTEAPQGTIYGWDL